jgi:mannose-P-dolichol utilization defect protein 1
MSALKFGLFSPECFDTLVAQRQFLDAPCLKKVIAKLIGFAVIAGSVILKVPQILKIVKSKSAEGLVVSSYALTLFTCIVNIAYNLNNNYPFSSYGENISIAIQDAIIVVLASVYGAGLGFSFVLLALVYASSTFALLTGMVAMEHILFLKTLNLPIFCASRLPQIYINLKVLFLHRPLYLSNFSLFLCTEWTHWSAFVDHCSAAVRWLCGSRRHHFG